MKLKADYVSQDIADTSILVPVGKASQDFHGIVRANKTAGFILACLREDTTEEELVDRMTEEYDVDRERAAADVRKVVALLKEIGALED